MKFHRINVGNGIILCPASVQPGTRKQNMLLKLRTTMELLKLCPGILSRVKPRVLNIDFQYAVGLRRVTEANREKPRHLDACIMLHELHENGHLDKARLGRADLREAWLSEVNLERVDLSGVVLSGATLFWVNLIRADLRGADLRGARLHEADLEGADLEGADLEWADLKGANLSKANLECANLSGANVTDEQLAQAKSLKGATMPDGTKHE